jgi:hypothetical protein
MDIIGSHEGMPCGAFRACSLQTTAIPRSYDMLKSLSQMKSHSLLSGLTMDAEWVEGRRGLSGGETPKGDALIQEPRADALHTYITEDWVCFGIGAFGFHILSAGTQQK